MSRINWSAVGAVVALVGLPIAILSLVLTVIQLQRDVEIEPARRELTIDVLSELLLPDDLVINSLPLGVTYDGEDIPNLVLASVSVFNSGEETIRPDDFFENPSLIIRDGHIIDWELVSVSPSQKAPVFESRWRVTDEGTFEITPVPLGKGDRAFLTLVGSFTPPVPSETPAGGMPDAQSFSGFLGLRDPLVRLQKGEMTDVNLRFRSTAGFASFSSPGGGLTEREASLPWVAIAAIATSVTVVIFGFAAARRGRRESHGPDS